MTDNEKLVAEAADAILWSSRGMDEPGVDWPADRADAARIVAAVLAVFEKAHTPTDDEREALIEDARRAAGALEEYEFEGVAGDASGLLNRLADLAAGFRRSEVPEPSTEDWDNRDDEVNGETRGFLSCGRCAWSMSRGLFADLHEHERTHDSEPQGEPSSEVPEPSAEDEFAPGECDGSGNCSAPRHIHGCYTLHRADQCDAPDEYGHLPAEPQGEPSDAQEAVRRLKDSGVGAYMILAAVTKVYDMETKP